MDDKKDKKGKDACDSYSDGCTKGKGEQKAKDKGKGKGQDQKGQDQKGHEQKGQEQIILFQELVYIQQERLKCKVTDVKIDPMARVSCNIL
ncbi:hypothetical protein EOD39_2990 [Acipenser ruthenus]|uniref:Uncharacterized protein n=1 Tax=Acipenser ruthenus TaxID=7906 RepID=A0A444TX49_ACIRT|nr:hypothetical protein EOD39_2990 [Acipenser ruthenus]